MKITSVKAALVAAILSGSAMVGTSQATAADSCGFFAFAGAFSTSDAAWRRADRVGGQVWSIDASNSASAGRGLWAVAKGPGSRWEAKKWQRQYKRAGVRDAYVANRCFYGE